MRKKIWTSFLIMVMGMSIVACQRQGAEESRDDAAMQESQPGESKANESEGVQRPEKREPEILYCRVPKEWLQGKKVDQAAYFLGKEFLESRIGTVETAKDGIEKYGYCIEKYWDYGVESALNTASADFYRAEEFADMDIQDDGKTWVIGYKTEVSQWGSLPRNGGAEFQTSPGMDIHKWNLGDWWILHQEGEVFALISRLDYEYIQEADKEHKNNPFGAYPVSEEDLPEIEYQNYGGKIWGDEVWYYEPLQTYLWNETLIFEYEADTESSDEGTVKKAALELGKQYLEELCSKKYDPDMTGKHVRALSAYYVKEYKDLDLAMLENSTDRTLTRLKERGWEMQDLEDYVKNIPPDDCIITDMLSLGGPRVKAAENIWIAQYSFLVKSDNPIWGDGEKYVDYREAGLPHLQQAVIAKQGKKYYMVMSPEIIMGSDIRFE